MVIRRRVSPADVGSGGTDESKEVGQKDGGSESKGHESGRRIVEILNKDESDYDEDDLNHIRRVVSYVHCHQAQKPEGDVENSNWRYSLMNWGHGPLKQILRPAARRSSLERSRVGVAATKLSAGLPGSRQILGTLKNPVRRRLGCTTHHHCGLSGSGR